MCGIAGSFALNTEGKKYLNRISEAISCISHRGPDGEGIFLNDTVALGHRRLSIIDTSAAANQPMYSRDKRYIIIFNGEIFNYKELQAKYFKDYFFNTTSDTEVFLELFIKIGTDAFKELHGFFAAAIYDNLTNTLFIVRDRVGKKPVLYYQSEDTIVFASEIKSLFSFGVPKKINWSILPVYLQLNYVPQPYSMIEGVKKLNAGCYLKIEAESIQEHYYHQLKTEPAKYNTSSYEDAQKKLVKLMDRSVQLRLISDVPLGAFLSGGIDSSVVVALASQHTKHLKTFSVGYKDHSYFDETKYANLVAKKWNTDHTVFSLSNDDFLEHIFDVLNYIDEPFADSSAIPEYILSNYTRKHVTVALSGDGGDEVFAGYNKHAAEWDIRNQNWKGKAVTALGPVWKVLPKSRSNKVTNLFRQLNRYSSAAQLSFADRYWQLASFQTKEEARKYLQKEILSKTDASLEDDIKKEFASFVNCDFNDVLLADMKLVLLSDMLIKVDLMSMANSLEIRSPFLDQEVVEFAFGLPASYKIAKRIKKRIVQDAFRSMLPPELYNRPKRGFEIPLLDWLRKELWNVIDKDLLSEAFIMEQKIFDVVAIEKLKNKLRSPNPGDSHAVIWAVIVFQYWWKKYIM
jgi:asparagine synthase (glutamine-hydrolysing)